MAHFQPIPFAARTYNDEPKIWGLCCRVLNASYSVLILEVIFNILIITDTVIDVLTSADDPALLALPLILIGPSTACLIALYNGLRKRQPSLLTPYLIWRVIHTTVWSAGEIYFALKLSEQIADLKNTHPYPPVQPSSSTNSNSTTSAPVVGGSMRSEEYEYNLELHVIAHQLTIAFIALYILCTLLFLYIIANCRAYFQRKRRAEAEFSKLDRPMRELELVENGRELA